MLGDVSWVLSWVWRSRWSAKNLMTMASNAFHWTHSYAKKEEIALPTGNTILHHKTACHMTKHFSPSFNKALNGRRVCWLTWNDLESLHACLGMTCSSTPKAAFFPLPSPKASCGGNCTAVWLQATLGHCSEALFTWGWAGRKCTDWWSGVGASVSAPNLTWRREMLDLNLNITALKLFWW